MGNSSLDITAIIIDVISIDKVNGSLSNYCFMAINKSINGNLPCCMLWWVMNVVVWQSGDYLPIGFHKFFIMENIKYKTSRPVGQWSPTAQQHNVPLVVVQHTSDCFLILRSMFCCLTMTGFLLPNTFLFFIWDICTHRSVLCLLN